MIYITFLVNFFFGYTIFLCNSFLSSQKYLSCFVGQTYYSIFLESRNNTGKALCFRLLWNLKNIRNRGFTLLYSVYTVRYVIITIEFGCDKFEFIWKNARVAEYYLVLVFIEIEASSICTKLLLRACVNGDIGVANVILQSRLLQHNSFLTLQMLLELYDVCRLTAIPNMLERL